MLARRHICFSLACAAAVLATALSAGERPDPRTRALVDPVRAWGSVDAAALAAPKFGQVAEGAFLVGSGPVLKRGEWVVLDFGRELHGGVQIGAGARSGKSALAHVRFGESVSEAMSAANEGQRALNTVRDYWGGMLDMGATSFWEDFNLAWTNGAFRIDEPRVAGRKDVHGDYGDFCYRGFRHSLCHGWAAGPAAWCINHVLGIRPLDVGCRTVEVKPFLGDLAWAEGAMALPGGGSVKVRAEKRPDGSVSVSVEAPDQVTVKRAY